ncbi:hypothetical protein TNCV_1364671 [Trichonephila clavipes]|nr:hypothetical protein TNCV_1364671 [Trichonephila clavipes]
MDVMKNRPGSPITAGVPTKEEPASSTLYIMGAFKFSRMSRGSWVAYWLEHRIPDQKAWVRCPMPPNTLRVHAEYVSCGWSQQTLQVQGAAEFFPPFHFHA